MQVEVKHDFNRKPGNDVQGSYRLTKSEVARIGALLESVDIKSTKENIKKVVRWLITRFDTVDPEEVKALFLSEYPKYDSFLVALEKIALQLAQTRRGEEELKARGAIQLDLLRKVSEFALAQEAVTRGEKPLLHLQYVMCRVLFYAGLEYLYDRDEAVFNAIVERYSRLAGLREEEALAGTLAIFTLLTHKAADWRKSHLPESYEEECDVLQQAIEDVRHREM
jgi:hypothetical protein